jgi:hypothetical protein
MSIEKCKTAQCDDNHIQSLRLHENIFILQRLVGEKNWDSSEYRMPRKSSRVPLLARAP